MFTAILGRVQNHRRAVIATLIGATLFGTSGTAQALGPAGTSPITIATLRLLGGGLLLLLLLPSVGYPRREVLRQLRWSRAWLAALFTCGFQILYFAGAAKAGVALGALLTMGTVPVLAGLIGHLFGYRVNRVWAVATLICAGGLALLAGGGAATGNLFGVILAIGSGVSGACFSVTVKSMFDHGEIAVPGTNAAFIIAGTALLPALAFTNNSWLLQPRGWALAGYQTLICMALPNILWLRGMKELAPGPIGTLGLLEPVVATALGLILLGETISTAGIFGMVLVLVGLLLQSHALTMKPTHA